MKNYRVSGTCNRCRYCIEVQLTSNEDRDLVLFCNIDEDVPNTQAEQYRYKHMVEWQNGHMVDYNGTCDLFEDGDLENA